MVVAATAFPIGGLSHKSKQRISGINRVRKCELIRVRLFKLLPMPTQIDRSVFQIFLDTVEHISIFVLQRQKRDAKPLNTTRKSF